MVTVLVSLQALPAGSAGSVGPTRPIADLSRQRFLASFMLEPLGGLALHRFALLRQSPERRKVAIALLKFIGDVWVRSFHSRAVPVRRPVQFPR